MRWHLVGGILEELNFDVAFGLPQEATHEIYGDCVQRLLLFMLPSPAVYIMAHPNFHKESTFLENASHLCEEYFTKLEEM